MIEDTHKRIETIKMMVFSSEIMRNLMMDLLDLAQMENSTFKLNKEFFSIRNTIKKVFSVVGHIADKKNVQLVKIPVSEHEEKLYNAIYGDESRFVQVIINFLSNSLKFSESGSKIVIFLKTLEVQALQVDEDEMRKKIKNKTPNSSIHQYQLDNWNEVQSLVFDRSIKRSHSLQEESKQFKPINVAQSSNQSQDKTCYIKFELGIQDFGCGIS